MNRMLIFPALIMSLMLGCSSQIREAPRDVPLAPAPAAPMVVPRNADIHTSLSDGPGITALINKNYNEDTTSCTEYGTGKARGYYWCTGVLVRTTDNGGFKPWESSPTALRLQATSYSWIRHDLRTSGLYRPAGFVLLNQADIISGVVPGLSYAKDAVRCVYPFDAWTTRTMNRGEGGCDFEGTGLGYSASYDDSGTCARKLGLSTSDQWNSNFNSVGQVHYNQCSWSADNQQGWRNMIASHNAYPAQSQWNEVMLYNYATAYTEQGYEQMRLWTVAYFYDIARAGGLSDAQAFQRRMAATGKRVPILRLSFAAPAAQRFQFQEADQVTGIYP